jgi:hypothetical protein
MNLNLFDDNSMPAAEPLLQVYPVIDYSVRGLCPKPYHGHKKGCPKFGDPKHAHRCPPGASFFDKYFDLTSPVFAVINDFDLEGHMAEMKQRPRKDKKPWTEDQLRCVLYWQNGEKGRIRLRRLIDKAMSQEECRGYEATECPEGMGVNVTETLKRVGVTLEWPVSQIKTVRQVAFLAKPSRINK